MEYKVTTGWLNQYNRGDVVRPKKGGENVIYDTGNYEVKEIPERIIERNPDWFQPIEQVKEGNWAEIVDQTPHIEINGYEAEFHEDYVKFGRARISKRIFQELHYANNQCGGELFRTGFGGNRAVQGIKIGDAIFRTDQINEIANYYE